MRIRRLGYALGAEITGIDLREPVPESIFAKLRTAWLEHLMLCFPGQDLTKGQLTAFARSFGEIEEVYDPRIADRDMPGVSILTNRALNGRPWDGYKHGSGWHSDFSFHKAPTMATFLFAREVPEAGGDTIFANQYTAYQTLSPRLQAILQALYCVHDYRTTTGIARKEPAALTDFLAQTQFNRPVVHPAVLEHPESRRPALFVRGARTRRIVGMTEAESAPLLQYLHAHAVRYEFTYRHCWHAGDLVMWDNRPLMHVAPADFDMHREYRTCWRVAVAGAETGEYYEGALA